MYYLWYTLYYITEYYFLQKKTLKLPSGLSMCMAVSDDGCSYAVGCSSAALLIDCDNLQVIKEVPFQYNLCGKCNQGNFIEILIVFINSRIFLPYFSVVIEPWLSSTSNSNDSADVIIL